ncbi:DUF2786 domain-containing protein [Iamia sp.]|uniref:DUF2786 domain-containing protein n=1 Tax=Iamia sp. TaxID=2722710 RepID=UPI002B8B5A18|nr:DUF2786 domain-containing protein [Iamia sp.]HXH58210.1 DUF2786 domain-containing protein [Iamia sp.]
MSTRRKTLHKRRPRRGPGARPGPSGPEASRSRPDASDSRAGGRPDAGPGRHRDPGAGWGERRSARDEARPEDVAAQMLTLLAAGGAPRVAAARHALRRLPPAVVVNAAQPLVEATVAAAWTGGWQPAELEWHTRRVAGAGAASVLVAAVAADAVLRAGRDLHPLWRAQLSELGITPPERPGHVPSRWLHAAVGDGPDAGVEAVCDLVAATGRLPQLQVLLPVPGRPDITLDAVGDDAGAAPSGIEPRVLERVRALLAKAEATTFEAEAQAFTAKAHELMTRHSLEHATVARPGSGPRTRPVARRLLLDDPYADAKALLVHVVAGASRCRSVSQPGVQMSTVVGFESDVEAVEVLFTSLLVQAQTALQELARRSTAGSRERSRGFRSSFLRGFAHRIGDRLEAAGDAAVADVDRARGGALVPVLAAREAEVDEQMARLFPAVTSRAGSRPVDALGYRAGSAAAERADLPWEHLASGT